MGVEYLGKALIVDPFTSGAIYAKRIKELYGYDSIALVATKELTDSILSTMINEDFVKVFYLNDDIYQTIEEIELYLGNSPDYILCGHEAGGIIFDILSDYWKLLENDKEKSMMRRDKYLMQKILKENGVNYIPSFKSSEVNNILTWCRENDFDEYVIKPMMSLGTEGVSFCQTETDIIKSFYNIYKTHDCCGNVNQEVLVQRRVTGNEYVVDAVSSNGRHFINNMFKYTKFNIDGSPVYHQMETIEASSMPVLVGYIEKVLSVLGVNHGPSHSEVILSENGPVLVETGARMHGGLGPTIVESCNSHSLIDLSILSRISTDDFEQLTKNKPQLTQFAIEYFLKANKSGIVNRLGLGRNCEDLESFWFKCININKGDFVNKTVDHMTSYGRILLKNHDINKLKKDVLFIEACEVNEAFIEII